MRRAALAHPACSPRFPSHPLQSPRDYLTPPCRTTLLPRHFPLLPPPSPSLFLPPSRLESVFPSPTLPRSTTMCRVPPPSLWTLYLFIQILLLPEAFHFYPNTPVFIPVLFLVAASCPGRQIPIYRRGNRIFIVFLCFSNYFCLSYLSM